MRLSSGDKLRVMLLSELAGRVSHFNAAEGNWSEESVARQSAIGEFRTMQNMCRLHAIPDEILAAAVEGELL